MALRASQPRRPVSVSTLLLFTLQLGITSLLLVPNRQRWFGAWRFAANELAAVTAIIGPVTVALAGVFAFATTSASLTALARSSNRTKGSVVLHITIRALVIALGAWTVAVAGVFFIVVFRASVGLQGPTVFQIVITYVYLAFCSVLGVTSTILFPRVVTPLLAALGLLGAQTLAVMFSDFESERGYDLLFPADGLQPTLLNRTVDVLTGQASFWLAASALLLGVAYLSRKAMVVSIVVMFVALVVIVPPRTPAVSLAADSRRVACSAIEGTDVCVPKVFEYRLGTLTSYLDAPVRQLKREGLEISKVAINAFDPVANRFFADGSKQVVLDFDLQGVVTPEDVRSALAYGIADEYDETRDLTTPLCPFAVLVDKDGMPLEDVPDDSLGAEDVRFVTTVSGDLLYWTADLLGDAEVVELLTDEGLTISEGFGAEFVDVSSEMRRLEFAKMHERLVECAQTYGV